VKKTFVGWLVAAVLIQKSETGVESEVLNLKDSLASLYLSISPDFSCLTYTHTTTDSDLQ
jgi:hypothetical protein